MIVQIRALYERARSSLFWVPTGYVIVAVMLAVAASVVELTSDLSGWGLLLFEADAESVRSVLQTVATASITVAGLVFPVMVIALQLASSQFSPRVLRGFLRDRVIQHVLGFVVGTFAFTMVMLASTPVQQGSAPEQAGPSLAVTIAVVLAILTLLAIIAFIHHSARYMQVVEIISRTTNETRSRIDDLFRDRGEHDPAHDDDPGGPTGQPVRIAARRAGFVQQIDDALLLHALPGSGVARVDVAPGAFVVEGQPLVTVWGADADDPDHLIEEVHEAFAFGTTRTMQDDVTFGIRQIVDIALRALSPAVNDPTTAYEVTIHLGAILRDVLTRDLPRRVIDGEDGRRVFRPHTPTHADYVAQAFDQLRLSAAPHPVAAINVLDTIGTLIGILRASDLEDRVAPLRDQILLTVAAVESRRPLPHDLAKVHGAAARALGVEPDELPEAPREPS